MHTYIHWSTCMQTGQVCSYIYSLMIIKRYIQGMSCDKVMVTMTISCSDQIQICRQVNRNYITAPNTGLVHRY